MCMISYKYNCSKFVTRLIDRQSASDKNTSGNIQTLTCSKASSQIGTGLVSTLGYHSNSVLFARCQIC